MKKFESTEFPDEHADFISQLREEHAETPFVFSKPRENIKRISEIALANNIKVERIRGMIELNNWSYDTVWLNVLSDEEYLIDLSMPIKNKTFVSEMGMFVARAVCEIPPFEESDLLEELSIKAEFDERVVAEIPQGVRYFGSKFI